jgi:hypothetical protein
VCCLCPFTLCQYQATEPSPFSLHHSPPSLIKLRNSASTFNHQSTTAIPNHYS